MTEQYLKSIFIKALENKSESHKTKTTITVLAYGNEVYIEERPFENKNNSNEKRIYYYIGIKEKNVEYPLSEQQYKEFRKLFDETYNVKELKEEVAQIISASFKSNGNSFFNYEYIKNKILKL